MTQKPRKNTQKMPDWHILPKFCQNGRKFKQVKIADINFPLMMAYGPGWLIRRRKNHTRNHPDAQGCTSAQTHTCDAHTLPGFDTTQTSPSAMSASSAPACRTPARNGGHRSQLGGRERQRERGGVPFGTWLRWLRLHRTLPHPGKKHKVWVWKPTAGVHF